MRYAAFLLGVIGGVIELAGAVMGLGIAGIGFLFGPAGIGSTSLGVGFAMVLAVATIFAAVGLMFIRDPRQLAIVIAVAAVGAGLAGGPYAAIGAVVAIGAAALAYRVDRAVALS